MAVEAGLVILVVFAAAEGVFVVLRVVFVGDFVAAPVVPRRPVEVVFLVGAGFFRGLVG